MISNGAGRRYLKWLGCALAIFLIQYIAVSNIPLAPTATDEPLRAAGTSLIPLESASTPRWLLDALRWTEWPLGALVSSAFKRAAVGDTTGAANRIARAILPFSNQTANDLSFAVLNSLLWMCIVYTVGLLIRKRNSRGEGRSGRQV
jgi:hypothetical protein